MLIFKSMTAEQWAIAKKALANEGHELVDDTKTNVSTLFHKLETSFPTVYDAIKKGVADAKDSTKSGGERAVAVAEDALAVAPAVLADLPGIKDALVASVTSFFASEVSDFKTVTTETITAL